MSNDLDESSCQESEHLLPDIHSAATMASAKVAQTSSQLDRAGTSGGPHTDGNDTPRPTIVRTVSRISTTSGIQYKVYKRRFFGLTQLCLLNIIVSWGWIAFAPVSQTSAQYFNTSETTINWLSTSFLFAYVAVTPFTLWALNKRGPKFSITIAACLVLVGSWIKYAGTKANRFGVVMFGQLLLGFAQPFVLSAPTSYSNLWFGPAGRTTATALASLANPFGAALGQLISPFWADQPSEIPNMILYITVISSAASLPAFFIPARPPTPPSAGVAPEIQTTKSIRNDLRTLFTSPEFYMIFIPFSVYVGFFNAFSSLLNQILEPYSFTEDNAGIAGAILIVVGLVVAAVASPLIDKYKFYQTYIKSAVPVIALAYLVFVWAPASHSLGYVFTICGILGAASFSLVPIALEFLVEIHYPLGAELSSSVCWSGGQLLGGIFVVVMDALKAGTNADPSKNMRKALYFQAATAMIVMPLPLCLGLFGRKTYVRRRRWETDKSGIGEDTIVEEEEQPLDEDRTGELRI